MPESIKHLIEKFVLNQCSPEEVERLVAYFEECEIDDAFPKVEEVLAQLKEKQPQLTEEDSERLYKQILKKTEGAIRLHKAHIKRYKFFYGTMAAAVFAGIIGATFYFGLWKPDLQPETAVPSITISAQLDSGVELVTEDGQIQNLSYQGERSLMGKDGEVIGTQKDNSLIYHKKEKESKEEIKYNTLKVSYGHRFELKLADGSHVVMNAGSSLKYPVDFPRTGNREVFLTGEAFFDVVKDPDRPFVVNTKKFEVGVLGTQFNVSAYEDESSHNVVLVEGSVDLNNPTNPKHSTRLEPGQLAELTNSEDDFSIREVDTDIYTAWMKGGLVFRNVSFENMLQKMARHYNVTIINKNKTMAQELFNANFGDESLETILQYYKEIYGLNYNRKQDTIIIVQPKKETME